MSKRKVTFTSNEGHIYPHITGYAHIDDASGDVTFTDADHHITGYGKIESESAPSSGISVDVGATAGIIGVLLVIGGVISWIFVPDFAMSQPDEFKILMFATALAFIFGIFAPFGVGSSLFLAVIIWDYFKSKPDDLLEIIIFVPLMIPIFLGMGAVPDAIGQLIKLGYRRYKKELMQQWAYDREVAVRTFNPQKFKEFYNKYYGKFVYKKQIRDNKTAEFLMYKCMSELDTIPEQERKYAQNWLEVHGYTDISKKIKVKGGKT